MWSPDSTGGTYCDAAPAERPRCDSPATAAAALRGLWRPFDVEHGVENAAQSIYFDGCIVLVRGTPWGLEVDRECSLSYGEQGIVALPALSPRDGVLMFGGCGGAPTELRYDRETDVLVAPWPAEGSPVTRFRRVFEGAEVSIEHDLLSRCEVGAVTGTPTWMRSGPGPDDPEGREAP